MRSTAFQGTGADEPVLPGQGTLKLRSLRWRPRRARSETEFLRALEARFRVPCASPGHFLGPDQKFRHCQLKPQDFSADLQDGGSPKLQGRKNGFCRVRRFWQHTNKHSCAHVFVEPHYWVMMKTFWAAQSGYRCGLQDTIDLVAMLGVKRFPEVLSRTSGKRLTPSIAAKSAASCSGGENSRRRLWMQLRDVPGYFWMWTFACHSVAWEELRLEGARRKRGHRGRTGNRWK